MRSLVNIERLVFLTITPLRGLITSMQTIASKNLKDNNNDLIIFALDDNVKVKNKTITRKE